MEVFVEVPLIATTGRLLMFNKVNASIFHGFYYHLLVRISFINDTHYWLRDHLCPIGICLPPCCYCCNNQVWTCSCELAISPTVDSSAKRSCVWFALIYAVVLPHMVVVECLLCVRMMGGIVVMLQYHLCWFLPSWVGKWISKIILIAIVMATSSPLLPLWFVPCSWTWLGVWLR